MRRSGAWLGRENKVMPSAKDKSGDVPTMGAAPFSRLRIAARLANGFALDLVKLSGFGRDVVDGLLLTAISQANVTQITRSRELQMRYATLDTPPPDEIRRPVSINAVAASLHMPFETVRRRVRRLAKSGVVKITARGVIVPSAQLNTRFYRVALEANYRLVRALYANLRAIGVLEDLSVHAPPYPGDAPPYRIVVRLSADYLLRLAEPLTVHMPDPVNALLLMDLVLANTEHIVEAEDLPLEPNGFLADSLRRPVRATVLAQRLGIPQETVRRHLAQLIADGRCERTAQGYWAPARAIDGPFFRQFMVANPSQLHRMFEALADYGIVSTWKSEETALRGAA